MARTKESLNSAVSPFSDPAPTIPPPPLNRDCNQDEKPFVSLINKIPTSKVTKKKVPAKSSAVPRKKVQPTSPFLDSIVRKLYFSLTPIHSFVDIPSGKSIIIHSFRKSLPHERVNGAYILIDAFDNLWSAPEVFLKWRENVDGGAMKELDLNTYWLSIGRNGEEFHLYTSLWRDSYKAVQHPAPPHVTFTSNEEEAFPPDSDEDSD